MFLQLIIQKKPGAFIDPEYKFEKQKRMEIIYGNGRTFTLKRQKDNIEVVRVKYKWFKMCEYIYLRFL